MKGEYLIGQVFESSLPKHQRIALIYMIWLTRNNKPGDWVISPSNPEIATATGMDTKTIRGLLRDMEEAGLFHVVTALPGATKILKLNTDLIATA